MINYSYLFFWLLSFIHYFFLWILLIFSLWILVIDSYTYWYVWLFSNVRSCVSLLCCITLRGSLTWCIFYQNWLRDVPWHQNMSVSISANMRYKICDILLNVLKPQLLIKLFRVPYKHYVTMSLEFIKWLQVLIVKLIYYYSFNICLINLFVSII